MPTAKAASRLALRQATTTAIPISHYHLANHPTEEDTASVDVPVADTAMAIPDDFDAAHARPNA